MLRIAPDTQPQEEQRDIYSVVVNFLFAYLRAMPHREEWTQGRLEAALSPKPPDYPTGRPLSEPTLAMPRSEEKIAEMAARYHRREAIFHPADAKTAGARPIVVETEGNTKRRIVGFVPELARAA